jgi:hypothetical protein
MLSCLSQIVLLGLPSRSEGCCSRGNFLDICNLLNHLSVGPRQRLLISVDNPVNLDLTINANDICRLDNYLLIVRGLASPSEWGDIGWQGRYLDSPNIGTRFNQEVVRKSGT